MSFYTTQVRNICESLLLDEKEHLSVNEIISRTREKIFNFDYPIYDEEYRGVLETKILKHYFTREIGAETVELWKLWLDTRLNEIMPYYNKLYKSAMLEFNPLYDTDITTKHNGIRHGENNSVRTDNLTNTGNTTVTNDLTNKGDTIVTNDLNTHSEGNTDGTNDSWNTFSDTPQGGLQGVRQENYLTNATHDDDTTHSEFENDTANTGTVTTDAVNKTTGTVNTESTISNTGNVRNAGDFETVDDYTEHIFGKRGGASYSSLIEEYRKTIINIDLRIINELSDLFMNIWGCI